MLKIFILFCIKRRGGGDRLILTSVSFGCGVGRKEEEEEVLLHLITCKPMHHAASSSRSLKKNQ